MPAQFFVRLLIVATRAFSARAAIAASARHNALAQQAVCEPANMLAIRAMRNANIEAVSVMQDVATGALVVFAASRPAKLDVSTQVLPRALSKVFLAASGWDRKQPDLLDIRVASLLQCTISLMGRRGGALSIS